MKKMNLILRGESGNISIASDREGLVKKLKVLINNSAKLIFDSIKKNILESDKVFVGEVLSKK